MASGPIAWRPSSRFDGSRRPEQSGGFPLNQQERAAHHLLFFGLSTDSGYSMADPFSGGSLVDLRAKHRWRIGSHPSLQ